MAIDIERLKQINTSNISRKVKLTIIVQEEKNIDFVYNQADNLL
jgi:hypothetical protein